MRLIHVLIFTESNTTLYDLSHRHLIPALTHEMKTAECKQVLEAYRAGDLTTGYQLL